MTILLDKDESTGTWADFDEEALLEEIVRTSLDVEGYDDHIELSVTFTDEEGIREANRTFRGMDAPTDVLSFPMLSFEERDGRCCPLEESKSYNPESNELMFGDIVLCIPKVISQAAEYGHSVRREYAFLLVHSMLHLMGYDHESEEEREKMEGKQRQILEALQIFREERI